MLPEERYGEEIDVAVRSGQTLADDGKRLPGDGRYAVVYRRYSRGEVRRGDRRRGSLLLDPGGLLPNAIYIYIYTQTQLFRIPILERFWRGSGEDSGDQK